MSVFIHHGGFTGQIYVLLAAAVLTAVMGHWVDTLVILGVAVINALIGHIQESNAEKSLKSIRNMPLIRRRPAGHKSEHH